MAVIILLSYHPFRDSVYPLKAEESRNPASGVMYPGVFLDQENGIYHLWYAGQTEGLTQIGHATARAEYFVYLPLISRNLSTGN